MSKKADRHNPETLRNRCKATLQALSTATEKSVDLSLRNKVRLLILQAHETGLCLQLSDSTTELGALMARANLRTAARGWL